MVWFPSLDGKSPLFCDEVIATNQRDRFERSVDPGLVKVNPLSEDLKTVDVKVQIVEVPRQICMTKDNVSLNLTSVIYYQVISPHKAAFGITNIKQALIERTQTTLRHVIGARVLQDVIERREEIAQSTSEIIEDVAGTWGVLVESMLVKDIIFSDELQDSLSMAAQSKRIGESKVIAARAEVESAKLMRQVCSNTFLICDKSMLMYSGRRHPLVRPCHANPLSRGNAIHGQDCQQQGHLPARDQPDRATTTQHRRQRGRRTQQIPRRRVRTCHERPCR